MPRRSIRLKLSLLLALPLTSLAGLWVFAVASTAGDSAAVRSAETLERTVRDPGAALTADLGREHLLSAEYLATKAAEQRQSLDAQRKVVDRDRELLRETSTGPDAQDAMTEALRARNAEMLAALEEIDAVRADVDAGSVDLALLPGRYGVVPEAVQQMVGGMPMGEDVAAYQQSRSLDTLGYAKDHLTGEIALASGVLMAGREFSDAERLAFSGLATTRQFLFQQAAHELEPALRRPFQDLTASTAYQRFLSMESQIIKGEDDPGLTHDAWRQAADEVDKSYAAAYTLGEKAFDARVAPAANATFVRSGVAGLLGLVAVVLSVLVSLRLGRALTRELGGLRAAGRDLATVRLPRVVERLRRGEKADVAAEAPPIDPPGTTLEIADVATTINAVRLTAVDAAVDLARLRENVGEAMRNLARRNQNLNERQLRLLDSLHDSLRDNGSAAVDDSAVLDDLFKLDHLTSRMRRTAESVIILSGGSPGRPVRGASPISDLLTAAVGEVEDFGRVRIQEMPDAEIAGSAVPDLVHLFAELIENATSYSPPHTMVMVRGEEVARGLAIEVEDRGLGLSPEEIDDLNRALAYPPEFDLADTDRLGLAVVGRLAVRQGAQVELKPSAFGGTTAIVLLPASVRTHEGSVEAAASR